MTRFLLVAVIGLAACGDSEQDALNSAQATWAESGRTDAYAYKFQRQCECDGTRQMLVGVLNEQVISAIYVDDETEVESDIRGTLLTVEGVFDVIQDAIDRGAFSLTVTYDPTLGHPTLVSVDYEDRIADDEFSITIRDLGPLALP